MSSYPSQWETHIALSDGTSAQIRPITPDDRDRLDAFHRRQSSESIYFRFFRHRPELSDRELSYFTEVDYTNRMAFVVLVGEELVGVGRYEKLKDRPVAEVAFFVDDESHGRGIATILLEYLAAAARSMGFEHFVASVLPENYAMLAVFRKAGFDVQTRFEEGVIEVEIGIEVTEAASTAISDRRRRASARSIEAVLRPRSVLLVGASRRTGSLGNRLALSLVGRAHDEPDAGAVAASPTIEHGFGGPVALVNRSTEPGETLAGQPLFRTVGEAADALEVAPDLVVVAVPADDVGSVIDEVGPIGARTVFIVSSGFSEQDEGGLAREQEIVERAWSHGMRVVGPNGFALINTDPEVCLPVHFEPPLDQLGLQPGSLAVASDSGPLGAALLHQLTTAGVGVGYFVGIGNQADVDLVDLLHYWSTDDTVSAIVMYADQLGNVAELSAAVGHAARAKPVIALAPGSSAASTALAQNGAIMVDSVSELTDQSALAAFQPVSRGPRVAVISNSASVARLTVSSCVERGLDVVVPSSAGSDPERRSVLVGNLDSVALSPAAEPELYEQVMVATSVSEEVDALILALAPTNLLQVGSLRRMLNRVNRAIDKPIVAVALVDRSLLTVDRLPTFAFPEQATAALRRWADYDQWLTEPVEPDTESEPPEADVDREPLRQLVADALEGTQPRVFSLVDDRQNRWTSSLALPVAPFVVVDSAEEARKAAESLSFPVVLKAGRHNRRSVGESGGAAIDLLDGDSVEQSYQRMIDQLGPAMQPAVVQNMVDGEISIRIDLVSHAEVGAFLSVGLGGWMARAVPASAHYFLPLDRRLAVEMAHQAVDGADGDPGLVPQVAGLLESVATIARDVPEVSQLTLNPVLVGSAGALVVDWEVTIRPVDLDPLDQVRHL